MTDDTEPTVNTTTADDSPATPTVDLMTEIPDGNETLFRDVTDIFRSFRTTAADDLDALSDDAFLQAVHEASDRLEMEDIPREERVEWIIAAFRLAMIEGVSESVTPLEYRLELMFGL